MTECRRFDGKVAIVTGSTDGIGYAIAKRLAEEGAKVVVSSRKQKNVDSAVTQLRAAGLHVHGLVCHAGKPEHRARLIEETLKVYGGIDILVNNAAVNPHYGNILEISPEAWDKIFDVNVKSTFFLSRDVVPHMEKRGGGSIIFVSSNGGYSPSQIIGTYSVSKTALLGLIKAMAYQCAEKKIRVNCIAPGLIKTHFSEALWTNPAVLERVTGNLPIKRIGLPDECAGAVAFLASEKDSSYITGETILVAGGFHARL